MYNKRKLRVHACADEQVLVILGKIKKIKRLLQSSSRFLLKMPCQIT